MGERPHGFSFVRHGVATVVISHHGRRAAVVRGSAAQRFLDDVAGGGDAQLLMARLTGNYRRGNERAARRHPRNAP